MATRIVVERERERMAFRSANYWDLTATFTATDAKHAGERPFSATLLELDGARIATGRDFAQDGTIQRDGVVHLDQATADGLAGELRGRPAEVQSREAKPYRRTPAAPFITSTYQQEASRKLRLSSSQAMRVAQGLYERGYITYMRDRLHHPVGLGGERGPGPDRRAVRRPVPARRAPHLPHQGQERPGGPRGDPPRRRHVPHPPSRSPAS